MLPAATDRILRELPDDALVLDVGGWAAPFNRADYVIDLMPYETRGAMGAYGPPAERFSKRTWVCRDVCDREPWPFADDQFDFAICVTTLEDVRDPVGVCRELSRVAKAGYVEVPTVEAELIFNVEGDGTWLGHDHHRWFCDLVDGELVFTHKPHSIHSDWRLRVLPRWREEMTLEDHLLGAFWEGTLNARERVLLGPSDFEAFRDELRERVRTRFRPSPAELAVKEARDAARHGAAMAAQPLRRAAERAIGQLRR
jgi:SAM-dependent methyltransferase